MTTRGLIKLSLGVYFLTLQCFDTVGWVTGKASGLKKPLLQQFPNVLQYEGRV